MSRGVRRAPPRASARLASLCLASALLTSLPRITQAIPAPAGSSLHREQLRVVDAAVAHMGPRDSGPSVYFVGFAGYGEQRVFRREAELARTVLGAHFGVHTRSLELINDVHDRQAYPLATRSNLREALRRVGERMNRDQDVLVLLITSHGSPDDGIAITNGRLLDDALPPHELRQALDASGIRWKIVVISACYAGIFIPSLKSDTTLVMTAADARHSSFGCADDRDLTYFGEALLHDTLPRTCSLESAFGEARRIIGRRESEEGEIHSHPQLYVGARMKSKLRQIEQARCVLSAPTSRAVRP